MKIAILLPDLGGGGVERVRLLLAHEFSRLGNLVEFVLMERRGALLAQACKHFPVHSLGCNRVRQLRSPLMRYLQKEKPDVLLAAMWPLTGLACIIARSHAIQAR